MSAAIEMPNDAQIYKAAKLMIQEDGRNITDLSLNDINRYRAEVYRFVQIAACISQVLEDEKDREIGSGN
jgi:hypothetical protein